MAVSMLLRFSAMRGFLSLWLDFLRVSGTTVVIITVAICAMPLSELSGYVPAGMDAFLRRRPQPGIQEVARVQISVPGISPGQDFASPPPSLRLDCGPKKMSCGLDARPLKSY